VVGNQSPMSGRGVGGVKRA